LIEVITSFQLIIDVVFVILQLLIQRKRVTNSMIDTAIAIKTSEQVVTTVRKLTNHIITSAIIAKGDFSSITLTRIKKYFKFTAHKNKDWIYAFSDSIQIIHEKRYQLRNIMAMSDINLNRK
jgi:hypothetical protein